MKSGLFAILSFSALAGALAGCGGDDTETTGDACFDYSSFSGDAPATHFQADVLPILQNSCGLSNSCHGLQSGPQGQPFLGPPMSSGAVTPAQIDAIFNQNVNVNAFRAPNMKIIAPGDPKASFLLAKLDNGLTCDGVTCGTAGCGVSMPQSRPILPADKRDVVRRWIKQGALKD